MTGSARRMLALSRLSGHGRHLGVSMLCVLIACSSAGSGKTGRAKSVSAPDGRKNCVLADCASPAVATERAKSTRSAHSASGTSPGLGSPSIPSLATDVWKRTYRVQGTASYRDDEGVTKYRPPELFFTGLSYDPAPNDGAAREPVYYFSSSSAQPSDSDPVWAFRWDMRPQDHAITELQFTMPHGRRWASFNFPLKSPVAWLQLAVGDAAKARTYGGYGGGYVSVRVTRPTLSSWRFDFIREGKASSSNAVESGYFFMDTDRAIPPWRAMKLSSTIHTTNPERIHSFSFDLTSS